MLCICHFATQSLCNCIIFDDRRCFYALLARRVSNPHQMLRLPSPLQPASCQIGMMQLPTRRMATIRAQQSSASDGSSSQAMAPASGPAARKPSIFDSSSQLARARAVFMEATAANEQSLSPQDAEQVRIWSDPFDPSLHLPQMHTCDA